MSREAGDDSQQHSKAFEHLDYRLKKSRLAPAKGFCSVMSSGTAKCGVGGVGACVARDWLPIANGGHGMRLYPSTPNTL
ncbi:hypothetical protein V4D00_21730 [Ralstonia solanacearum]